MIRLIATLVAAMTLIGANMDMPRTPLISCVQLVGPLRLCH